MTRGHSQLSRRSVMKASLGAATASLLGGTIPRARGFESPNARPRIGVIGCGVRWDKRVFVADGPYRKAQQKLSINAIPFIFQTKKFRRAAFGYWGHMWELYAFWGFLPVFIIYYQAEHQVYINTSLWSFFAIAIGAISCAFGGVLTQKISSKKVAYYALVISGMCCLVSAFSIEFPPVIFGFFLLIWGAAVVADSPQFSTLVAQNAPPEYRGTALTLVNCIGFAITVVSIQLLNYWVIHFDMDYLFLVLSLGPIFGILSLYRSKL